MDECLMMVWHEKIQFKYVHKGKKEIDFHKSLMVMDAFKANLMDDVAAAWF